MDNFNKLCEDLRKQKQVLQAQYDEARSSAISHVQQIITDSGVKPRRSGRGYKPRKPGADFI